MPSLPDFLASGGAGPVFVDAFPGLTPVAMSLPPSGLWIVDSEDLLCGLLAAWIREHLTDA